MKTSFIKTLCQLAALTVASVGTAHAVPAAWTDTIDPIDFKVTAPASVSYSHIITDGFHGYRPGVDSISGASLLVDLYDDSDFLSGETVAFNFDRSGWTPSFAVGGAWWSPDTFGFSVASLLSDGVLNVTLKATSGDFYFAKSTLVVTGDRATAVPEPATLATFVFGLLALAFVARRRQKV